MGTADTIVVVVMMVMKEQHAVNVLKDTFRHHMVPVLTALPLV